MSWIHALLLGAIEGITEFLPVSSTGHLILASAYLKLPQTEFLKSFEIAIQLGAILAVVVLYAKKVIVSPQILLKVITAFIPTAIIGLLAHDYVKAHLLSNIPTVLISLFAGGVILILFENMHRQSETAVVNLDKVSIPQAILIGLFQSIAIIPGVSRAAATVIGGMLVGISRATIVEFSFLLAIPTMAAATGLDLLKTGVTFTGDQWMMLGLGFVVAFITALLSVKWLISFIQRNDFASFGYYRIVLAVVAWFVLMH